MTQTPMRVCTPEDYLEREAQADYKSEYRDGEIVAMAGGTTNRNELALNLASTLKLALRQQNYKIYIGDVRLWMPSYRHYTYPDVMVIQGAPSYAGTGSTTVTNPTLIAEVLSQSTQNYDQGEKFLHYRSIPELREYLLIDQTQFHLMQYAKNESGQWVLTEYEGAELVVNLSAIALEISLTDLYTGIDFNLREEA